MDESDMHQAIDCSVHYVKGNNMGQSSSLSFPNLSLNRTAMFEHAKFWTERSSIWKVSTPDPVGKPGIKASTSW